MAHLSIFYRCICVFVIFLRVSCVDSNTFISDSNLEKLLAMENDLIQISNYILRQESIMHGEEDAHGIANINSTIEDTKLVHTKIGRKTMKYLAHPFNIYHLVKRLSELWGKAVKTILLSDFCQQALEIRLKNVLDNIPTSDQVTETAKLLVKLQYLHDLDLEVMARGEIRGEEPLEPVTPDDIFHIGMSAYENEDHYNAILWLQKATEVYQSLPADAAAEVRYNQSNTLNLIASSYYKLRRLSKAVETLDELSEIEPQNTRLEQTKAYYQDRIEQYGDVVGPPQRSLPKGRNMRTYDRLCKGEQIKSPASDAKLKCFYHPTWKKFINIKAEMMNRKPLVLVLHDIADSDTTEAIRHMGYRQMTDTALADEFQHSFPSVTVHDKTAWGWLKKVESRYDELTNLLYPPIKTSPFEVRNFGMAGAMDAPKKPLTSYSRGGEVGNFVLFLKDVEAGGEIILPKSKTRITTERGSAVFFYATQDFVAVCPTLYGSQWLSWKTYYEKHSNYCRITEAYKYKKDY